MMMMSIKGWQIMCHLDSSSIVTIMTFDLMARLSGSSCVLHLGCVAEISRILLSSPASSTKFWSMSWEQPPTPWSTTFACCFLFPRLRKDNLFHSIKAYTLIIIKYYNACRLRWFVVLRMKLRIALPVIYCYILPLARIARNTGETTACNLENLYLFPN